jgi:hypothetical protein
MILVLVQKGSNSKFFWKVFVARNLKDKTKFTTQNNEKKENQDFLSTTLCFPD